MEILRRNIVKIERGIFRGKKSVDFDCARFLFTKRNKRQFITMVLQNCSLRAGGNNNFHNFVLIKKERAHAAFISRNLAKPHSVINKRMRFR